MYIYNATVITMAEKNHENGFILIENDKIKGCRRYVAVK